MAIQKLFGKYKGEWEEDKPKGVVRWEENEQAYTIEGEWKDAQLHGHAVEYYPSGSVLEYKARKGKYHGRMVAHFDNDARWQCEYHNARLHGKRRELTEDGAICYEGTYRHGKEMKVTR